MKFIKKMAAAAAASVMAVSMMSVTAFAAQTNPVPVGVTESQLYSNWTKVTKYIETQSVRWSKPYNEEFGIHYNLTSMIAELDSAVAKGTVTKGDFDSDGLYTEYDVYVMRGLVSACNAHKLNKTTAAKLFGRTSSYYTILDVNGDKIVNTEDTKLVEKAQKNAEPNYRSFAAKYAAFDVDMVGNPEPYLFMVPTYPTWAELGLRGGVPYVDQNDVNSVVSAKGTNNTKYDFNKNGVVDDSDVRAVNQAAAAYENDFTELIIKSNPYKGSPCFVTIRNT